MREERVEREAGAVNVVGDHEEGHNTNETVETKTGLLDSELAKQVKELATVVAVASAEAGLTALQQNVKIVKVRPSLEPLVAFVVTMGVTELRNLLRGGEVSPEVSQFMQSYLNK